MRYIIATILICTALNVLAQPSLSTKSKKAIELYTEADNFRVRGQYSQAISLLKQAIDKDNEFVEAYYRMAITYMSIKDYDEALRFFEQGLALTTDPKKQKVFWFDLADLYFINGSYEKAWETIQKFLKTEVSNRQKIDRAKQLAANIQFARDNQQFASDYKQKDLSDTVNRFFMQYFPVLTADQNQLIFTRREGYSDEYDEDLVVSQKTAAGQWSAPESISKNINTALNEGTCTVSADGRKIIFTSCSGREGLGSCDLYESEKIGNEWTEPRNLGIAVNSAEWESQPSLSADGRTLYFVSDRKGGLGRRDIWVSNRDENGKWQKAKNVGKPVNTVYDEISPFIHVNNQTLYFASNGLIGFGGYDLFFSELDSSSSWSEPKNIGAPINTYEDQFSLFITADGAKGYYSHEESGKGNTRSRIIEVSIPEKNRIRLRSNYVHGVIRDKETREPLRAKIELIDINTNEIQSLVYADSVTGKYLIVLTQGAEYALYVNKQSYLFENVNFNYSQVKDFQPIRLDIDLQKIRVGSIAVLKNIFFDLDKYILKEKSITELQKVKKFLEENPAVRIEISGHTDNTGSASYNQNLSEKRAMAVVNFLVEQGISRDRISSKGYGSQQPVADNSTEEGRAKNRRIEFRLTN